jgi:hypothetical protein
MVPSRQQARVLAHGLGWFSIGLGVAQLLGGRPLGRAVGLGGRGGVMRACGLREIATGIGLLRSKSPTPWLWGRLAGDALDLVALTPGLQGRRAGGAGTALAAVAAVAAIDLLCARRLGAPAPVPAADYSRRSGWPLPASEMRGAARVDFKPPADLRVPPVLRPWRGAAEHAASASVGAQTLPLSDAVSLGAPHRS